MRHLYLLLLSLVVTTSAFAQKKEKLKGSKIVTVTQKEIGAFEYLEVEDNIEVFLIKGPGQNLEIEADDNLHEAIEATLNGNTLRIFTNKDISGFKKLSIRVTYTDNLKSITAKHETTLNALADIELDTIAIKNFDYSKSFLNVKSKNFSLKMNDKTKAELNLKAETAAIELSKNAELKALIATPDIKFDMYQKTIAIIEGDAANARVRVDNNASFTGKKFTVKNMELVAEGYSVSNIMATDTLILSANGKAQTQVFGSPKIDLKSFADSAVLYKKEQTP
jgi:hypothetical protein